MINKCKKIYTMTASQYLFEGCCFNISLKGSLFDISLKGWFLCKIESFVQNYSNNIFSMLINSLDYKDSLTNLSWAKFSFFAQKWLTKFLRFRLEWCFSNISLLNTILCRDDSKYGYDSDGQNFYLKRHHEFQKMILISFKDL